MDIGFVESNFEQLFASLGLKMKKKKQKMNALMSPLIYHIILYDFNQVLAILPYCYHSKIYLLIIQLSTVIAEIFFGIFPNQLTPLKSARLILIKKNLCQDMKIKNENHQGEGKWKIVNCDGVQKLLFLDNI